MKLIAILAWRNIWRNRRRTMITVSSVFFAVLLALIMRAMQLGSYDKMIRDIVEQYTGWIQIHAQGYWDEKTINNTMATSGTMIDSLESMDGVLSVIQRLESFALASGASRTRGVQVIGIEPEPENALTGLAGRVDKGSYITAGSGEALIAENLAAYLQLHVGDTVVLLGQGYHGTTAAGKYGVAGLVHFSSPELNDRLVYLPLGAARDLYSAENRVTSLVLDIAERSGVKRVATSLEKRFDRSRYEVMRWNEMLTELVQQIASDNIGGIIMLGILYMIVGFGIFGTVLMMTMERHREFCMVNAVGMTKRRMAAMISLENGCIALLGVVSGTVAAIPILYYFTIHPIRLTGEAAAMMESYGIEAVIPLILKTGLLLTHAGIVVALTALCTVYPLVRVSRMKVVDGIGGHG